jgi:hypothetical protein
MKNLKNQVAQARRRQSAQQRAEEAKGRTPEQQIARLDALFGVGLGATKERAKLAKKIASKA